jgi:hypothetical protein
VQFLDGWVNASAEEMAESVTHEAITRGAERAASVWAWVGKAHASVPEADGILTCARVDVAVVNEVVGGCKSYLFCL